MCIFGSSQTLKHDIDKWQIVYMYQTAFETLEAAKNAIILIEIIQFCNFKVNRLK